MENMNNNQLDICRQIVISTETTRKKIVMYKVYDDGLSEFRVIAFNRISDLIQAKACNKPYPKEALQWVAFWNDNSPLGNDIQDIFNQIDNYEV